MKNCTPQINPTQELQVVWRIGLLFENIEDDLVEDGDRSWTKLILKRSYKGRVYLPVTPAIVKGCAPKIEKMKAAINEAMRTSETPYISVVSMRSNENAIPGNTLDSG